MCRRGPRRVAGASVVARKLVAELVTDVEILRLEYDADLRRVTVWAMRLDREEPERHEITLEPR